MITKRRFIGHLDSKHFRVAIFGSARIKKEDKVYKNVYLLAKLLAERGIDVVTGGGPGLMEAANSGHKTESKITNAHSIGLGIKLPKEQKFNKSLDYQETFMRFTNRLDEFMLLSNAVVVADGGVGTLLELFYTWQLVQTNKICHIPIILMGDMWPDLIKWLKRWPLKRKYFEKKDLDLLFLAKDYNDVIRAIDEVHREFKKGNKNFCLNYKKYR
ncbi:MAG: LOG family protein [Nanoarchaeota archaeon]